MSDSVSKYWERFEDYIALCTVLGYRPLSSHDYWQKHLVVIRKENKVESNEELWKLIKQREDGDV